MHLYVTVYIAPCRSLIQSYILDISASSAVNPDDGQHPSEWQKDHYV